MISFCCRRRGSRVTLHVPINLLVVAYASTCEHLGFLLGACEHFGTVAVPLYSMWIFWNGGRPVLVVDIWSR